MKRCKILSPIYSGGRVHGIGTEISLPNVEVETLLDAGYPIIEVLGAAGGDEQDHSDQQDATPAPPAQPVPDQSDKGQDFADMPPPSDSPKIKSKPKVNINTASVEALTEAFKGVNGIGKGSAQAIFENRPYKSLEVVPDQADLVGIARASWPEIMPMLEV